MWDAVHVKLGVIIISSFTVHTHQIGGGRREDPTNCSPINIMDKFFS